MNVLVTGGSRGIGAACVRKFAENGHRVFLNYHSSVDQAQVLSDETGAVLCHADVGDYADVLKMADTIHQSYGGIDILINNAGISQQKLFSDITEQDWDRMFRINTKSIFNTAQAFLPYMIRKKSGVIINISSMWGICGASCEVHYSAAKAAVIGFTKALAKEVGLSGVRVNCIAPGVIDTDMNAHLSAEIKAALTEETPLAMLGTPEDIANTVCFLSGTEARFITGQVISVDGGMVI